MHRHCSAAAALLGAAAVLQLSGCTGFPLVAVSGTPSAASEVPPAPVVATPAPSGATDTAPPPSGSAPPTPTPSADPSDGAGGCSNGRTAIPAGAHTLRMPDIDGDGRADTEFLTEDQPTRYGIRTAAGGAYTTGVALAGPGARNAWTVPTDSGLGRAIVIDDGRTALVKSFTECGIVDILDSGGKPFTFGLHGLQGRNTGVACTDQNGGTLIAGAEARRRSTGRYDILWTSIGRIDARHVATLGGTETRWSNLAADDARVRQAMESHCAAAPEVVHAGGR